MRNRWWIWAEMLAFVAAVSVIWALIPMPPA